MSWHPLGNQMQEPSSWSAYPIAWLQYLQQRTLLALLQINFLQTSTFLICCCQPQKSRIKVPEYRQKKKLGLDTNLFTTGKKYIYYTPIQMASKKEYEIQIFLLQHINYVVLFQSDRGDIVYFSHQPKHIQNFSNSSIQGLLQI